MCLKFRVTIQSIRARSAPGAAISYSMNSIINKAWKRQPRQDGGNTRDQQLWQKKSKQVTDGIHC